MNLSPRGGCTDYIYLDWEATGYTPLAKRYMAIAVTLGPLPMATAMARKSTKVVSGVRLKAPSNHDATGWHCGAFESPLQTLRHWQLDGGP